MTKIAQIKIQNNYIVIFEWETPTYKEYKIVYQGGNREREYYEKRNSYWPPM